MNNPAVCQLSVIPVRSDASDKAEIVTQLLFGELVEILDAPKSKKNWCQIRCEWDSYEGWVDIRQLRLITEIEADRYKYDYALCLDHTAILNNNDHFLPITLGATLPCFDGFNCSLGEKHYTFGGQALLSQRTPSSNGLPSEDKRKIQPKPEMIIKLARRYLYTPYLWGGRSPFGIDCSGFTQIVFKMAGLRLRRDASQQIEQGRLIDFTEQSQMADLAFFDNEKGKITHVGIVMEGGFIIHSSGQVRIDKLDHYGIFNEERGIYSHKLRLIKRLLPNIEKNIILESFEAQIDVPENQMSMF